MTWIRVDTLMNQHPKVAALADALETSIHEAIGLLLQTWLYAAIYHIDGDLSHCVKSHFDKYLDGFDSVRLTSALRERLWLNEDGTMHDWAEYQGVEIARRKRNAKYMQEYRLTKKDTRKPSRNHPRKALRKGATDVRTDEQIARENTNANATRAAGRSPRAGVRRDPQPMPVVRPIADTMAALRAQLKPELPTTSETTNGTEPHA